MRAVGLASVPVVAFVLLLTAGCIGDNTTPGVTACGDDSACSSGHVCFTGLCRQVCRSDSDCPTAEACTSEGICMRLHNDCETTADCVSPGRCQTDSGARCSGGRCLYPDFTCEAPWPVNPCKGSGVCVLDLLGGACQRDSCCVFPPAWPEGSASTQPSCPLAGEDPEGDGVRQGGEVWRGLCDHHGACTGCVAATECDDRDPCSIDSCDSGRCRYDETSLTGDNCTAANGGDGSCVPYAGGLVCLLDPGEPCTADADCTTGYCECADSTCASRVCHARGCATCEYTDNAAAGTCLSTPAGSWGEACVGSGLGCSDAGVCALADGQTCAVHVDCARGHCECVDPACSSKRCSEAPCACMYNANADRACDGPTPEGFDDPEDCDGAGRSCYRGACAKDDGEPCAADAECGSRFCECTDSTCTAAKRCSPQRCGCQYNLDGRGGCDGPLGDGVDDAANSCGSLTCNGRGTCNLPNGAACEAGFASLCESNRCECQGSSCIERACSAVACPSCRFNANGDSTCEGLIQDGTDDAYNSCGVLTCNGSGGCNLRDGSVCTTPSSCESNYCECADALCSSRACSAFACSTCWFSTGSACSPIARNSVDPGACEGSNVCDGTGICKLAAGQDCGNVPSRCASGVCSCGFGSQYCCP